MCGIVGEFSWDPPPSREVLEAMASTLVHRGPDAGGVFVDGDIGFAHRRLAIIDTREIGNQPLRDDTGQFCIVLNGEVYNFRQLREELEQSGASFRTNTDTEVILESYKRWGTACLNRFVGMFAFAIWDQTNQRLFLARDRLGQKPLFYFRLPNGGLLFASELKALLEHDAVARQLNPRALGQYLSMNYALSNQSFVEGVRKLEAGHFLMLRRGGGLEITKYWDIASCYRDKSAWESSEQAAEALNDLLTDAVDSRLISDVPLGAFLSGGIDSSAVVAAMCRLREPTSNHTFSIGFDEPTYSEVNEARAVADHLSVVHRDKTVAADMAEALPEIVYYADEPFADTSIIPVYYLAQFAREQVKVCLSGDGGDEALAGYETYVADKLNYLTRWVPAPVVRAASGCFSTFVRPSFAKVSTDYKIRHFLRGHSADLMQAHFAWREIFSAAEKRSMVVDDLHPAFDEGDPLNEFHRHQQQVAGCHYLDQSMYVDIKTWLVDDILVKVDRGTMAHSLEARAPFLDHRFIEFAASLPVNFKLRGFRKKWLLAESQRPFLPSQTIDRAKKGFNAPISHWLTSSLEPFYQRLLESDGLTSSIIDRATVESLWRAHREKRVDNSLKLFSLINLQLWIDRFRITL